MSRPTAPHCGSRAASCSCVTRPCPACSRSISATSATACRPVTGSACTSAAATTPSSCRRRGRVRTRGSGARLRPNTQISGRRRRRRPLHHPHRARRRAVMTFEPVLEFVFEIRARIDPDFHIGRGPDERLSFTPVTGGSVAGPRLNGEVLSGGGDWAVERFGTAQLEARYLLRADDGAVIDILNRGYFRATPDVIARMEAGENVPEKSPGSTSAPPPSSRPMRRRTAGSPRTSSSGWPATRTATSASACSSFSDLQLNTLFPHRGAGRFAREPTSRPHRSERTRNEANGTRSGRSRLRGGADSDGVHPPGRQRRRLRRRREDHPGRCAARRHAARRRGHLGDRRG